MVKVKKVKNTKRNQNAEDRLISKGVTADDEESLQVADLSKVPAPEIEVELPDKYSGAKSSEKPAKDTKVLTPELLNREIVGLRTPTQQAIRFITQKLLRKKKFLSKLNEKKEDPKMAKKIEKVDEDLNQLKSIKKDEVARFAFMNDEPKNKLISSAKTAEQRILYSLIFEKPIAKKVEEYHETFSDWKVSAPYFLQRLGLQYKSFKLAPFQPVTDFENKGIEYELSNSNSIPVGPRVVSSKESNEESDKSETVQKKKPSAVSTKSTDKTVRSQDKGNKEGKDSGEEESEEESGEESGEEVAGVNEISDGDDVSEGEGSSNDEDDDAQISDIEMGTDSEDDTEKAAERRALLLGLAGVKENKNRPKLSPKKRQIVETDEENEEDPEEDESEAPAKAQPMLNQKTEKNGNKEKEKKKKPEVKKKQEKVTIATPTFSEQMQTNTKKARKPDSFEKLLEVSKLKSSTEGIIQRIKLGDGGNLNFGQNRQRGESEEEKKTEPSNKLDSFFQSGDADSDEEGEESADDNVDLPILNYPKGERGSTRQNVGRNKSFENPRGRGFDKSHKNKSSFADKRAERPPSAKKQFSSKGPEGIPEELHPSWAAKRLKKEQLAAKPQGTRTVFGED